MASAILKQKKYPLNYPDDITSIIDTMSFKGSEADIVGSMSLKSQQYAGDYDMFQKVNVSHTSSESAVKALVAEFQGIVKRLQAMRNVYIGDIKAGEVADWNVLADPKGGLDRLSPFLTAAEKKEAEAVLRRGNRDEMEAVFKFHIIRWDAQDIERGHVRLRDGRDFTLAEAFQQPALVKLDVVALVQNSRYTDFSIIYQFFHKGKVLNGFETGSEISSLREDVSSYYHEGNYFKAMKRMFSIAKATQNTNMIERLNRLFNSDLGRLYSVLSDIGTLQYLLDNESNLPMERIRYELDQFRGRLANVYTVSGVDKVAEMAVDSPTSKSGLQRSLDEMAQSLEHLLSKAALKAGKAAKVLPPPKGFRS